MISVKEIVHDPIRVMDASHGVNGHGSDFIAQALLVEPPLVSTNPRALIPLLMKTSQFSPPEVVAIMQNLDRLQVGLLQSVVQDENTLRVVRDVADALTAIGYSAWGTEMLKNDAVKVHSLLVADKHNGESRRVVALANSSSNSDTQRSDNPDLSKMAVAGVVTLTHAKSSAPSKWNPGLNASIGFSDLMVAPPGLIGELACLKPGDIGELTLFTIANGFRVRGLKENITQRLLVKSLEVAQQSGIQRVFAIMPEVVRRLLPKESYIVHEGSRLLQETDGEQATQAIQEVYKQFPGYWLGQDPQICEFVIN